VHDEFTLTRRPGIAASLSWWRSGVRIGRKEAQKSQKMDCSFAPFALFGAFDQSGILRFLLAFDTRFVPSHHSVLPWGRVYWIWPPKPIPGGLELLGREPGENVCVFTPGGAGKINGEPSFPAKRRNR
jgi:hypothetical protein